METIVRTILIIIVLLAGITGCLYIFDIVPRNILSEFSMKAVAALALLGGCTALILLLVRRGKTPQDKKTD